MDAWLSPNFRHDKLDAPAFGDLVDVFEDIWLHNILGPAEALLGIPHGEIAAISVMSSYFEALECCISGESSEGRSKAFFVRGLKRAFRADHEAFEKAAEAIYKHIRCGLAHEGVLSYRVQYSRACGRAFMLTYPKNPDGSLNFAGGVESIVVNPQRLYDGIRKHFTDYVAALRDGSDALLCDAFQRTVNRQWALDRDGLVIGATEEAFRGGS
jgi:hypothetical protein